MTRHTILLAPMLCISLLFSCTNVERDNILDRNGVNQIELGLSNGKPTAFIDSRDGKEYEASSFSISTNDGLIIWRADWMLENLNYDASGSKCLNEETCETYGRLYNWEAAMTACPNGWHLPSKKEWDELVLFVTVRDRANASGELRAKSGWEKAGCNGSGGKFRITVLPGGKYSDGDFINIGTEGYWWTSNKSGVSSRIDCYKFSFIESAKEDFLSVRCVKD